ncbi:MAG: type II secretion system F family protein [Saccharospirillaceae bacterium]|nr:type II secretion system F family protein [Pseudomonadales bacterium]NRB77064.1 type II secretion system F family protein [Saccharospirillaceae bacterium]
MKNYKFKGQDAAGNIVTGHHQAESKQDVILELKRKQLTPILIEVDKISIDFNFDISEILPKAKVKDDDLIIFCRQMFALTRAGISVNRAISGLAQSSNSERLKEILLLVNSNLTSGNNLATSLSPYKAVFGELFIAMIHVGESTGRLDLAFKQLINHLELEKDTKKKMKSATRYPMMVTMAIAVALVIINLFVIPKFAKIFSKFGNELPVPTKILMGTSDFFVQFWPFLLATLVISIFSWKVFIRTEKGELFKDTMILKLPIVGPIYTRITLGRFIRPFAMMLEAGVPMLQALSVTAKAVGNKKIGNAVLGMRNGIERGDTLLKTAGSSGQFNTLVLQMIAVGEETGQVSELLEEVGDFYEQEVEYDLKRMAEAIEPILLVFMGAMVLVLALGIFLPMWDLSSNMG